MAKETFPSKLLSKYVGLEGENLEHKNLRLWNLFIMRLSMAKAMGLKCRKSSPAKELEQRGGGVHES